MPDRILNFRIIFFQYLNTFVTLLYPLIVFPYITKVLGPASYGKLSFYDSAFQIIIVLAAFGIPYYGVREVSRWRTNTQKKIKLLINLTLLNLLMSAAGIVLFLLFIAISDFTFSDPLITFIYCISILLSACSLEWFFQGEERFQFIFRRNLFIRSISLILILVFVKTSAHLLNYVFLIAVTQLLTAISTLVGLRSYFSSMFSFSFDIRPIFKRLFVFALIGILATGYMNINTIVLAYFENETFIGYFSVANKIVRMGIAVLISSSIVFYARLASGKVLLDNNKKEEFLQNGFAYTIQVSFLAFTWVLIFAHNIVLFLNGNSYYDSIESLKILSPLLLVVPFHDFLTFQILFLNKLERKFLYVLGVVSCCSVILNIALIHALGVVGASISTLVVESLLLIASVLLSKALFPTGLYLKRLSLSLLTAIPVVYLSHLAAQQLFQSNFAIILSGLVLTLVLFYIIQTRIFRDPLYKQIRFLK